MTDPAPPIPAAPVTPTHASAPHAPPIGTTPSSPPPPDDLAARWAAAAATYAPWPYPRRVYAMRAAWAVVRATAWRLAWARWPSLRTALLRAFGARVAGPMRIKGSATVDMPWNLTAADHVVVGERCTLYCLGAVEIGSYSSLSQDVYVCAGTHDYARPTYPLLTPKVTIGRYVWVAAGAFIGPGVTIGDGAVVGARAVVVKDVPPWTVVAGNPARPVKPREMKW